MGMKETLKTISSILFKIFWIGFFVTAISAYVYYSNKAFYISRIVEQWHLTDVDTLNTLVLKAYTDIKLFLVYGILILGIAISWQVCQMQCKSSCHTSKEAPTDASEEPPKPAKKNGTSAK